MEAIIKIENLHMSYTKDIKVLNGINMEIYPGQVIGYIGPNGAGKSTTIKAMLGLVEYSEGRIKINGEIIDKSKSSFKSSIGYIPEASTLYESLTGYEYLDFVGTMFGLEPALIRKKAKELCSVFKIEGNLNERISSYSKGMKQKILIVSSVIHNPKILIFDEPLSGLDANSVMVFKEILVSLAQEGKTILYSSHIMDVVEKISDRILLIDKGQIVADGSFDELKKNRNIESLEGVFNELTGYDEYKKHAEKFVLSMTGGIND